MLHKDRSCLKSYRHDFDKDLTFYINFKACLLVNETQEKFKLENLRSINPNRGHVNIQPIRG